MLVVLDGIDGSGKTFIANLLKFKLEERGYKVWLTREPTDGKIGKLIRELLYEGHEINENWGRIMALLFSADRYYHQLEIEEKIKEGYIVISDRYYHSTFAYQVNYPGISIEWLKEIHKYLKKPDFTFILDVPVKIAIQRMAERKKKQMYERTDFLEKVRSNFLKLKEVLNEEIYYIDNTRDPETVIKDILKILERRLQKVNHI